MAADPREDAALERFLDHPTLTYPRDGTSKPSALKPNGLLADR
jgi:hypothetical protein